MPKAPHHAARKDRKGQRTSLSQPKDLGVSGGSVARCQAQNDRGPGKGKNVWKQKQSLLNGPLTAHPLHGLALDPAALHLQLWSLLAAFSSPGFLKPIKPLLASGHYLPVLPLLPGLCHSPTSPSYPSLQGLTSPSSPLSSPGMSPLLPTSSPPVPLQDLLLPHYSVPSRQDQNIQGVRPGAWHATRFHTSVLVSLSQRPVQGRTRSGVQRTSGHPVPWAWQPGFPRPPAPSPPKPPCSLDGNQEAGSRE